jgi:hypothetical protein
VKSRALGHGAHLKLDEISKAILVQFQQRRTAGKPTAGGNFWMVVNTTPPTACRPLAGRLDSRRKGGQQGSLPVSQVPDDSRYAGVASAR